MPIKIAQRGVPSDLYPPGEICVRLAALRQPNGAPDFIRVIRRPVSQRKE